uniref:PDGF_2 domain-containing protein n=1 Tax=Elaeophora elaphi TaxID=1147741 RepID=A0A0R3S118_9BILA
MTSMITLILSSLLLLLLLDGHPLAQKAIPNYIRKRVREARTFDELLSATQLSYAPHLFRIEDEPTFKDHKELHPAEIRSYTNRIQKVKLYEASALHPSIITRKSDFRQDIDVNTKKSLDILSTIRQGTDTCKLQKACVPILPENPDPGLLIFPRCYEVTQCIGSCCEFTERCHPTSIEYIQQPTIEMLYAGNNMFVINQTRNITIEQHTACSCQACIESSTPNQCLQKKTIGSNCDCECKNRKEKMDCQGPNKVWDDETCTCSCVMKNCNGRSILDAHTCLCYQNSNQSYGEPDNSGYFRSNTSRLQRLRLTRRRMPTKNAL